MLSERGPPAICDPTRYLRGVMRVSRPRAGLAYPSKRDLVGQRLASQLAGELATVGSGYGEDAQMLI